MKNDSGFTLIEVLIALVIIAIALIAIETATAQTIENTDYLWEKTQALWIANYAVAEIQCGLIQLPVANTKMNMLTQNWFWSAKATNTNIEGIEQVDVTVSKNPRSNPLISLTTYL